MPVPAAPRLIAVLNGPNLNLLGLVRQSALGGATLDDVETLCAEAAERLGLAIDFRQTNAEGELISWVHECRGRAAGIVINPAGYATTSVALADALLASELPVIEVQLDNPLNLRPQDARTTQPGARSLVAGVASGVLYWFGAPGYGLALAAMADLTEDAA